MGVPPRGAGSVICVSPPVSTIIIHLLSCLIPVLNLVVLLVVLINYMDDISLSKRRKKQGIHISLRRVSDMCIPSASATIFHLCVFCLIPFLTLVVLLVLLDDIDDISFSKRRYFPIVSRMSISVYCIPTQDTHITRDMCTGMHISWGYTHHCDTGSSLHFS